MMAELRTGATVGRFRLEREVARGGMGAVWAARDPVAPGRLVAVKTVIAAKSSSKLSQLFVEEARIARAVRHPNLVELYDAGEENGVPYLAMEWVEGLTLRALGQAPGELPIGVILRICMEACDGLHAVHEARTDDGKPLHIVHRDVSPHNLLVSIAGRVKVIDFGIAKARGRLASETTDGVLRGKVRYMSPEHARGTALDRRADIWSLGVTLLEVTTGLLPFSGDHDVATLVQLLSAEPKVPDHPLLPECVKRVVERALRRQPDERYPNARAMGTDLEAAIVSLGEKVTRRDVAHCVRMRIETARTQALRVPSFEVEGDEDDDGAATALFVAPRPALPPQAEAQTKSEIIPLPQPPPKRQPSAPSVVAGLTDAVDELLEEDLTNIRPVDVVMMTPSTIPGRRSSAPPAVVAPTPALLPRVPTPRDDGDTTTRLSAPPAAPDSAAPVPARSPNPPDVPIGNPIVEPIEHVATAPLFPSSAPPPPDLTVAALGTTASGAVVEAPPAKPPSRLSTKLVPALAAIFVAGFAALGAAIALGAAESNSTPGASPSPSPSGSEEAVSISAVRSPTAGDAAAAPKLKVGPDR